MTPGQSSPPATSREAIRRVLEGPKRKGHLLTEAEKDRAAHHEAGHVVVSVALGQPQPLQRVSVLGGGRSIATTELKADDEEQVLTEAQLRGRLAVRLAGPAAEQLVYGGTSTGVERDLEEATAMARDMVARYGMAPGLEFTRLLGPDSGAYLGAETPWGDIAEDTKAAADTAIRALLREAAASAREVLQAHRPSLDLVAAELLEHETLEGVTLLAVLDRVGEVMRSASTARPRTRRTTR